jgi:predicted nuclease of predicted toxin-antitoxin system
VIIWIDAQLSPTLALWLQAAFEVTAVRLQVSSGVPQPWQPFAAAL